MFTKIGEFNGKKTIAIQQNEDDDFGILTMGVRKAACVLEVIPQILAFVNENGNDKQKQAVVEFYKAYKPVTGGAAATGNGTSKKSKEKAPKA